MSKFGDPTQETGKTLTNSSLLSGQPKVIPPVGDAGNTFGEQIQQSRQGYMYFQTGRTKERVIVNNNFGRPWINHGWHLSGTTFVNVIESIQIASLGDSVDFGDLTNKPNGGGGFSSKTRGFVVGGNTRWIWIMLFNLLPSQQQVMHKTLVMQGIVEQILAEFLILREVYILVVKVQVLLSKYKQH